MERAKNLLKRFRRSVKDELEAPEEWSGDEPEPRRVFIEEKPRPIRGTRVRVGQLPEITFVDETRPAQKRRIPGLAKLKGILAWVVLIGNIGLTLVTYGDSFPIYLFFLGSSLIVLEYILKFRKPKLRWPSFREASREHEQE